MSAARLSPAATLLRNSKLFALPPAIALPPSEPSSEPVPGSDSATTIYPTRAAIETAGISLFRGDWGLKRPLPLKGTIKSRVIRLNNGVDTREHIADFDSATDHVMTLKKFQEFNIAIRHPTPIGSDKMATGGVFSTEQDNTTNLSATAPSQTVYTGVWPNIDPKTIPSQLPKRVRRKLEELERSRAESHPTERQVAAATAVTRRINLDPKRWRYDGPSLVQMSSLEFDEFLRKLDSSKRNAFRAKIKESIAEEREFQANEKSRADGTVGDAVSQPQEAVTDADVDQRMKELRQQPQEFGPLIAKFLDLPEGPSAPLGVSGPQWKGASNFAAEHYASIGPPRTHPSAGLSYIHHDKFAENDAVLGPQHGKTPVVSRLVRIRSRGLKNVGVHGVGGFIAHAQYPRASSMDAVPAYEPGNGGQKMAVMINSVEVNEKGAVTMKVRPIPDYVVEEDEAVSQSLRRKNETSQRESRPPAMSRVMAPLTGAKPLSYPKRESLKESEDVSEIMGQWKDFTSKARQ